MPKSKVRAEIYSEPLAWYTVQEMALLCNMKQNNMRKLLRQNGLLVELTPHKLVVPLATLENKCNWLFNSIMSKISMVQ